MDTGIIQSFKSKYKKKLILKEAIGFIAKTWEDVKERKLENEINSITILINDLPVETNSEAQQLINHIEEYTHELPSPLLTITEAVEVLEKVINYQRFDENGLMTLRKRLKKMMF
ncbi:1582_t:CDS:2 [Diversispora eburnea]|uniref:1582_t:CDS:1 n=1 Tax=Diversispora eburnea TaxID=1213867 RepID=A0A9N9FYG1_9GLOM|nr:1582_t:CDS:2 [Diversispora eburnea]